jgi:hypothetical protein
MGQILPIYRRISSSHPMVIETTALYLRKGKKFAYTFNMS